MTAVTAGSSLTRRPRGSHARSQTPAAVARRQRRLLEVAAAKHYAIAADDAIDECFAQSQRIGISNRRLSDLGGYVSVWGSALRRRTAQRRLELGEIEDLGELTKQDLERRLTVALEHRRAAEKEFNRAVLAASAADCFDGEIGAVVGVTAEAIRQRRLGWIDGSDFGRQRWTRA